MATGRVDVLRRRDSPKYSKRESEYYRNGHYGVKLSHGRDDGVRNRDHVWSSRRCGGQSKPFERAVQSVPEKKRKFSPVIWDKEEKKGKVSSNNAAVQVSVIPRSSPPLNRCCSAEVPEGQLVLEKKRESPVSTGKEEKEGKVSSKNRVVSINQFLSDGVVSKSPTSEIHEVEVSEAKPSEADGLREIPQLEAPADLHAPLQLEAQKNLVDKDQTRISLSRWASDSDSPMSDSCRSTPESGEIRREDSVRSRTSISGEGHSVGGDKCSREEIDGVSENGGFDHMYPDSEEEDDQMYPDSEEDDDPPRGRSTNMLQACRSVDEYAKLEGLGEGTYGVVYRAKDKQTGETVAIKKVKMDKMDEGFPITSLREINILLSCNHPSIVGVKEVVVNKADDIFMVMEYMEYDLRTLLDSMKQPFGIGEVKYLMKSLLEGVKYLHDNWILHRDLKTSNLLLNKEGELKICDFGMSRQYGVPLKPYTALVVTLWYRAPEILLGKKQYSTAIDMWSVGCIMAEFLAKEALFQGKNELDQLDKVFKILGTPIETDWPGVSKLPNFKHIKVKQSENLLPKKFSGSCFTGSPMLSSSGLDLLMKLLTYDPDKRIKVDDALSHNWFKDFPAPRAFKPSANVHERFMNLRQRQERDRHQRRR